MVNSWPSGNGRKCFAVVMAKILLFAVNTKTGLILRENTVWDALPTITPNRA